MGFLSRSTLAAEPYITQFLPILYLWTSHLLAIYILLVSLYIPYPRHTHHASDFFSPSTPPSPSTSSSSSALSVLPRVRLTNPGYLPVHANSLPKTSTPSKQVPSPSSPFPQKTQANSSSATKT